MNSYTIVVIIKVDKMDVVGDQDGGNFTNYGQEETKMVGCLAKTLHIEVLMCG